MSSGSESRVRSRHVTIRLSEDERVELDAAAERAGGLTPGSYARLRIFGDVAARQVRRPSVERRELARLLGELGKIGSNLNQLARAANCGTALDGSEIEFALEGLAGLRGEIMRALGKTP